MLILVFLAAGCSKNAESDEAVANSFKAYAGRFVINFRNIDPKAWFGESYTVDVRKTNSVVTPYIGILASSHESPYYEDEITVEFARQDKKWNFKRATLTSHNRGDSDKLPFVQDLTSDPSLASAYRATPEG